MEPQPWTGGCACGQVRYEVAAEPAVMAFCQCRQCQQGSGTGHGAHVTFIGAPVDIGGEASGWAVTGEEGTRKTRHFCPTCGTPTHMSFPDMPELFVASAASLDQPERFQPQMVMWTKAGHAWDTAGVYLRRFEKLPPRG
jgi:hypothetical protein